MTISDLGNGTDQGTEYEPHSWMREPRRSHSVIMAGTGITEPRYYIDGYEVPKNEYETSSKQQLDADRAARSEKEFDSAADAFAYAATLSDGVVLDWGRRYAAMEREGLKIGFVDGPHDQPIVTPEDFAIKPGPNYILVRRDAGSGFGRCCTDFMDESKSWSEDEVEVIADGTGQYERGQHLHIRVSPNMGARASIGRNWRMKLIRPEDIQSVLPTKGISQTLHTDL